MSQMAKGLVLDIAMKLVADESQDVINAVRDACETDADAERRAGIYLFGSFESASANLQKLDAEIERIVNTAKSTFATF